MKINDLIDLNFFFDMLYWKLWQVHKLHHDILILKFIILHLHIQRTEDENSKKKKKKKAEEKEREGGY